MTDSTPGGHPLPARFSGAAIATVAPAPRRATRRRRRSLRTALCVSLVTLVIAALQLTANLRYDDVRAEFESASATASEHRADLAAEAARYAETREAVAVVVDTDSGSLLDTTAREALLAALASADATADEAHAVTAQPLAAADAKPVWVWELFAAAGDLAEEREDTERRSVAFEEARESLHDDGLSVRSAGTAALESAAGAAAQWEQTHVTARALDVIALREAAASVLRTSEHLDADAADAYRTLEAAAARVVASEQEELAEKAGPLLQRRLEVEDYARSLAPGVLLDFDWSRTVNGYGHNGSMAGYTTWWYSDPGRATIEFSDSVATHWPSARSRALIAHEVGHAISLKCTGLYDTSTQESIEAWATAWAISMGHTDDANGVWAYGRPPQSLIETAATCR